MAGEEGDGGKTAVRLHERQLHLPQPFIEAALKGLYIPVRVIPHVLFVSVLMALTFMLAESNSVTKL